MSSKVVVIRAKEGKIEERVNKLFSLAGGVDRFVRRGEKVLIKPNFLNSKPSSTGCTTSLELLEAILKIVVRQGATPVIAESTPVSFDTMKVFKRLRVDRLAEKYNARLVDMNKYKARKVKLKNSLVLKEVLVSEIVFECDKLINLPVMKTHTQTTITLGMKNLMGCLPGNEKSKLHLAGISQGIVDICTVIKPDFTIIDGIIGMEGAGPSNGKPKRMNLLIGSEDLVACEFVGARIMGFEPLSIRHISLAKEKLRSCRGGGRSGFSKYFDEADIEVIGEKISKVKNKFSFPVLNVSVIFGKLYAGHLPLMLSKLGVDVNRLAEMVYDLLVPYPVFLDSCRKCKRCVVNCPASALTLNYGAHKPLLDRKKCIKCYVCDEVCLYNCVKVKRRNKE